MKIENNNKELIKTYNYLTLNKQKLSIKKIIDIENLIKNINNNDLYIFGNNTIIKKNNLYEIKKEFNINILNFFNKFKNNIDKQVFYYFNKEIKINNIEEAIFVSLLEIFVLLELFNENIISFDEFLIIIKDINYINSNIKKQLNRNRNRNINRNVNRNTNLLQTNLNNIEFPRDLNKINNIKLQERLNKINLPFVEIPINKDNKNLVIFLKNLLILKENLNLKKFDFNLRFKRILNKNKEGMYIVNSKTIIIDPRKPDAIYHEIGHYIYENKLSFTFNNKRFFYSKFNNIIKKAKELNNYKLLKSKIEDYNLESEIFAYWFENLFKF